MIKSTNMAMSLSLISFYWISGQVRAAAQALPTATQSLEISAFGGITATHTGLGSAGNRSITFGGDFGFRPVRQFYPSLEFRSTEVLDSGAVDGQKNILGGLKVAGHFARARPYGDLLIGRGSITYGNGYQVPDKPIFYTISHGNVVSVGGGMDYEVASQFSFKMDAQYQRYATPVTASGHLFAASATLALGYRFNFSRR